MISPGTRITFPALFGAKGFLLKKLPIGDLPDQSNPSWKHEGLPNGKERFYRVTAFNDGGAPSLTSNSWYTSTEDWITDMPSALRYSMSVVHNGEIYVLGGFDGSSYVSTFRKLDPSTGTWTVLASYPNTIGQGAIYSDGTYIHAGQGYQNGVSNNSQFRRYDPVADSWGAASANTLPYETNAFVGAYFASIGSNYYIGGGFSGQGGHSAGSTWRVAQIGDASWTSLEGIGGSGSSFPTRHGVTAVGSGGNYIYILGGITSTNTYHNRVYRYDVSGDSWTRLTDISTPPAGNDVYAYGAGGCLGSKIILAGYFDNTDERIYTREYDIDTDTWSDVDDMPTVQAFAAGCVDKSNNLLWVLGGRNSAGAEVTTVQVYAGEGATSPEEVSAPSTPGNPNATAGDGEVTVAWDQVADADGYKVYGSEESGFTVTPGANESAPTAEVNATPSPGSIVALAASGHIYVSPLGDLSTVTQLTSGHSVVSGVVGQVACPGDGYCYFPQKNAASPTTQLDIWRVPVDGSAAPTNQFTITLAGNVDCCIVDDPVTDGKFLVGGNGGIVSVDHDGSNETSILSGAHGIEGMAVQADGLYILAHKANDIDYFDYSTGAFKGGHFSIHRESWPNDAASYPQAICRSPTETDFYYANINGPDLGVSEEDVNSVVTLVNNSTVSAGVCVDDEGYVYAYNQAAGEFRKLTVNAATGSITNTETLLSGNWPESEGNFVFGVIVRGS